MGDLGQSTAHFEDALAFCGKASYRLEIAWTCCAYADTLLQRNELAMRLQIEGVLSRRDILKA